GEANQPTRFPAILEQDQSRNSSHIEARRDRGIIIHVDLEHLGIALKLFGSCFERRRHCAAWTAPRCPKIDKDWLFRLQQLIIQSGFIYVVHIAVHWELLWERFRTRLMQCSLPSITRELQKHFPAE